MTNAPGRLDICLVAAMTPTRVIGKDGTLPWRIPSDLKRFKELTTGHGVVMGYTTFAKDLRGKPLPNRVNYVVTRRHSEEVRAAGATPIDAFAGGIVNAWAGGRECFVIGGAQIYAEALPLADRMCVTMVDANIEGDTHFPDINWGQWEPTAPVPNESVQHDPRDQYPTRYIEYVRIRD